MCLCLYLNYGDILRRMAVEKISENEDIEEVIEKISKRYGEIMLPEYDSEKNLSYSQQFGLVVLNKDK